MSRGLRENETRVLPIITKLAHSQRLNDWRHDCDKKKFGEGLEKKYLVQDVLKVNSFEQFMTRIVVVVGSQSLSICWDIESVVMRRRAWHDTEGSSYYKLLCMVWAEQRKCLHPTATQSWRSFLGVHGLWKCLCILSGCFGVELRWLMSLMLMLKPRGSSHSHQGWSISLRLCPRTPRSKLSF